MPMKFTFLLLLLVPLSSFNGMHKFYVSTTDIEFVAEKQELQVISKVFLDDIEKLLKTRYSGALVMGKNEESNDVDKYLEKYFNEKFRVKVNGKNILLEYLGHTYDDDLVKCFLKAEGISALNTIDVSNTILLDLYEEQQNVVHIDNGKRIKSLLLMKDRENDGLNFR